MRIISRVWVLRPFDAERLANLIWRMALILFGLRIILEFVAAILWLSLRDVGMEHANIAGLTLAYNGVVTVANLVLQLLAIRFLIEVGLRVLRPQNPERREGAEAVVEAATTSELTRLIPPVAGFR